jgi:hypothetical protein
MANDHSLNTTEDMSTTIQTKTKFDPTSFGKLRLKSHDSLFTIDDLIRSHAAEPEDFTLIGAPVTGLTDFEEHSARDINRFADAAAARLQEMGLKPVVIPMRPEFGKRPLMANRTRI